MRRSWEWHFEQTRLGSQRAVYFAKRLHDIRLFWLRRLSTLSTVRERTITARVLAASSRGSPYLAFLFVLGIPESVPSYCGGQAVVPSVTARSTEDA
jgi:hypothetical protein